MGWFSNVLSLLKEQKKQVEIDRVNFTDLELWLKKQEEEINYVI